MFWKNGVKSRAYFLILTPTPPSYFLDSALHHWWNQININHAALLTVLLSAVGAWDAGDVAASPRKFFGAKFRQIGRNFGKILAKFEQNLGKRD